MLGSWSIPGSSFFGNQSGRGLAQTQAPGIGQRLSFSINRPFDWSLWLWKRQTAACKSVGNTPPPRVLPPLSWTPTTAGDISQGKGCKEGGSVVLKRRMRGPTVGTAGTPHDCLSSLSFNSRYYQPATSWEEQGSLRIRHCPHHAHAFIIQPS